MPLEQSSKQFGRALAELLAESEYVTSTGNPNWHAFARMLDGFHYETLRKAAAGERNVSPRLIEEVARVLSVSPEHFLEYRLSEARRLFDPAEVGVDQAVANLEAFSEARRRRRRRPG